MIDETPKQSTPTTTSNQVNPMRVVILNQYYVPDVASTGHLLFELAENIASQGAEVSIITCRPSYGPKDSWQKCPRNEEKGGVKVHRMFTTRYSKDSILGRVVKLNHFPSSACVLSRFAKMQRRSISLHNQPPLSWICWRLHVTHSTAKIYCPFT